MVKNTGIRIKVVITPRSKLWFTILSKLSIGAIELKNNVNMES